jgi:hypothetical protein
MKAVSQRKETLQWLPISILRCDLLCPCLHRLLTCRRGQEIVRGRPFPGTKRLAKELRVVVSAWKEMKA